jgi:uncharacterized repeat protein (TIGR03833 family)
LISYAGESEAMMGDSNANRGGKRANIQPGMMVRVVQKQHQRSGQLTTGRVARILTSSATHPHGIKVQLENGIVGRVKEIVPDGDPSA